MGDIFWAAKISNFFFLVFEIPEIFGVKYKCWPEPRYEKKIEYPPPPWDKG